MESMHWIKHNNGGMKMNPNQAIQSILFFAHWLVGWHRFLLLHPDRCWFYSFMLTKNKPKSHPAKLYSFFLIKHNTSREWKRDTGAVKFIYFLNEK